MKGWSIWAYGISVFWGLNLIRFVMWQNHLKRRYLNATTSVDPVVVAGATLDVDLL